MRVFFDRDLDTVATFWRIYRRDGLMLAFTSHDRDLFFAGIRHRAAPGMVPASIRLTADLSEDSAEVRGALSHATIREEDLAAGLFDQAAIEIGAVDWETSDHHIIYSGQIGRIEDDRRGFTAELRSAKRQLDQDLVPRTSPTCRALFCGPGCGQKSAKFTSVRELVSIDIDANAVAFEGIEPESFIDGQLRFLDGPQTGIAFGIMSAANGQLSLDRQLVDGTQIGTRTELREGCDHTVRTCAQRFGNAVNFRGEPSLPGNDLLSRYGPSSG
ncbi:MAG: DUF2163 domain-containing protein [Pseudomonadota bacterium]